MADRREFLRSSGAFLGSVTALQIAGVGALFNISCTRRDSRAAFSSFSVDEAAELVAVSGQIIPSSPGSPGAKEAEVIYFIDAAVEEGMPFGGMLPALRQGLVDLSAAVVGLDEGVEKFSLLDSARQISILDGIQTTPFFGMLSTLTVIGFFADPKYGGNKNSIGWDLIGRDNKHAWQPPFGFYDANYTAEESTNG